MNAARSPALFSPDDATPPGAAGVALPAFAAASPAAKALGPVPVAPLAWDKQPRKSVPPAAAAGPPAAALAVPLALETLHPALWRGHQLGRHAAAALPSGFAALDAQLPGAGWPRRVLTELLLPHPGIGEVRLLAGTLAAVQRSGRLVMLFDPPAQLSAWALEQLGIDVEQLLVVQTRARVIPGADSLWAFEQALKSGHVGAAVAWLPPRLRAERVRRLQLAAQAHDGPAFVLRELAVAQRPSAAPLRLALRTAGADVLAVRVLKRRGPPLEAALLLELPPVLGPAAQARARVPQPQPQPAPALQAATFVSLA